MRLKPDFTELAEAHSLYVEALSELGIVGLVLLLAALGCMAAATLTAGATRGARAAAAAVAMMWMLHAAVDWDWELPATAIPLFCLAGAAARRVPATARGPRLALAAAVLAVCALPAAWAVSQGLSDRALGAYASGDCATALPRAERALKLMPWRPEAHMVRAACLARTGRTPEARAAAARAAELAPGDWRYRYDRALVLAATGERSVADAIVAYRLAPRSVETYWIRYWLTPGRPRAPRRTAALAPLVLAGDRYPPVLAVRAEPTT
jgi:tetratricopeptide (TPR) repeat protein